MDFKDHEDCGHNNLPVLNESSILSTSEPILKKQDEPTDVSMKIDLDELDEAMIQSSHSRSLSDNTRE